MRAALGRLAAAAGDQRAKLHAIFAEAENPARVDSGLRATAGERLRILGRLGARAVDPRYARPELSGAGARARHLMLLRLDVDDAPIDRAIVRNLMHEFYRALGVSDPEADRDFAAMFLGVGASVGTRTLPTGG
jgi:hypothetical protein